MSLFAKFISKLIGGIKMDKDIRHSVHDVANYFLAKCEMTPKKLQKILYFAYAWYLAIMNESKDELRIRLFDNHFEAWVHGPVCPEVYSKYKHYGASLIEKYKGNIADFTDDDIDILEQVWDVYGTYTANQLESITHQHDPWIKVRKESGCSAFDWCDGVISDKSMFEYYASKLD